MGASFFRFNSLSSNFLSEKQCKNPIDKPQGSFLKHILGVYSRGSNWAVESKTSRNCHTPHCKKNDRILQSSKKFRKSYYYLQFKIVNGVE